MQWQHECTGAGGGGLEPFGQPPDLPKTRQKDEQMTRIRRFKQMIFDEWGDELGIGRPGHGR